MARADPPMSSLVVWVEVDERLPPSRVDVLLACADGVQPGSRRGKIFLSYVRGNHPVFDVTHWAFMPEHPLND